MTFKPPDRDFAPTGAFMLRQTPHQGRQDGEDDDLDRVNSVDCVNLEAADRNNTGPSKASSPHDRSGNDVYQSRDSLLPAEGNKDKGKESHRAFYKIGAARMSDHQLEKNVPNKEIHTKASQDPNSKNEVAMGQRDQSLRAIGQDSVSTDYDHDNEASDEIEFKKDDEWHQMVQEVTQDASSGSFESLQTFLRGLDLRNESQDRFLEWMNEFQRTLKSNTSGILEQGIGPAYDSILQSMHHQEREIEQILVDNHARRSLLRQNLTLLDNGWKMQFSKLEASIFSQEQGGKIQTNKRNKRSAADQYLDSQIKHRKQREGGDSDGGREDGNQSPQEGGEEEQQQQIDWDALLEDSMGREQAKAFLQGRQQWQEAQDRFAAAMEDIQGAFENCNERIRQSMDEAYNAISVQLEDQQSEIKDLLCNNFKRRSFYQSNLEDIVQKQQSMYAKLMAQITGVFPRVALPAFQSYHVSNK